MELALNLFWCCLTIFLAGLYLRVVPASTGSRRLHFVALALVVIILLPAISMTDDLMAAQNPAEIDVSLRRAHDIPAPHAVFPPNLAFFVPLFLISPSGSVASVPDRVAVPISRDTSIASIDNRPPPRF
jgi:hypothetical protein